MFSQEVLPKAFATIWVTSLFSQAIAGCYQPAGTLNTNPAGQPCPNVPTICCALNRTNSPGGDLANGLTRDECLPSGICQNRYIQDGVYRQTYWRGYCTNSDWTSGDCLDICTQGNAQVHVQELTPCDGTSNATKWCCGTNTDCCNQSYAVILPTVFGAAVNTTLPMSTLPSSLSLSHSTTGSSATLSTKSTTTPASPSSTASFTSMSAASPEASQSDNNSGLSAGVEAGIGIGAAFGGVFLLALGFVIAKFLLRKYRRAPVSETKKEHSWEVETTESSGELYAPPGEELPSQWYHHNAQLDVPDLQYEMSTEGRQHELP